MKLSSLVTRYLTHLQALGRSDNTMIHYRDSLKLLERFLTTTGRAPEPETLTTETMNDFASWLRATPRRARHGSTQRSEVGVHGVLVDTKAFVHYLIDEELIDWRVKVPIPRVPQQLYPVLTDAELARVFACDQLSPRTEIGIRNRALIAFMLDTGVRLSEVSQLGLADLHLKAGEAKIHGKGQKERLVFFSDGAAEAIRRWLAVRGEAEGPLFWLAPAGVRMVFVRIGKAAGLSRFAPHQLRHTCFTNLVRANVDLHTVKRLAGHASVTTTESYLALSGEDMKAKYRQASPFERVSGGPEQRPRRRLKTA